MQKFVVVISLLVANLCFSWGIDGHVLVAQRAESKLTPIARNAIHELLESEPTPTLAGVANWADDTKNKQSAPWHFVNFPHGDCHYTPERDCPNGQCAVAAIERYTKALKNTSLPLDKRRKALKYLVHLVGDIHQPLHAGYADDKGGNKYQVQFDGKGTNLHKLWDSLLLHGVVLSSNTPDTPMKTPMKWSEESCEIVSRSFMYPDGHKISQEYMKQARAVIKARLELAGDRLAWLLNDALGNSTNRKRIAP